MTEKSLWVLGRGCHNGSHCYFETTLGSEAEAESSFSGHCALYVCGGRSMIDANFYSCSGALDLRCS